LRNAKLCAACTSVLRRSVYFSICMAHLQALP
jgi:hypothetical protein